MTVKGIPPNLIRLGMRFSDLRHRYFPGERFKRLARVYHVIYPKSFKA